MRMFLSAGRLKHVILAVAGLALFALIGTWEYRMPLAARAITSVLEKEGFGPVQIVVDEVGPRSFMAHDVSLRGGAIHAAQVKALYDPFDLAGAHIQRVTLAGFRMSISAGSKGIEVGGKPFVLSASDTGYAARLRIDAIEVPDAQIVFDSSVGKIDAKFAVELALASKEIRGEAFAGHFSAAILGRTYSADVEAKELGLERYGSGETRLRISRAALATAEKRWSAQSIDGAIDRGSERSTMTLSVGGLADQREPKLIAPLSIAAKGTLAGSRLDFALDLGLATKPAQNVEIKGRHDLSTKSGAATLSMQPIKFMEGSLQPADISPMLDQNIRDVTGSAALSGSFRWDRTAFFPSLLVHLEDLNFDTSIAHLRALTGTVRLVRLWPPATAPGQTLSATVEAGGMPPAKVRLGAELTSAPALNIERAEAEFAGGQLTATPFVIEPGKLSLETTLAVNGVDLAELTKLLNLEAISGTGLLDGSIPFTLNDGKVAIVAGRLTARGPGVLRYRPDKIPNQIASAGESVALTMQALSDFHYQNLSLDLNKADTGEGTVLLRLGGSNPAVMDNQPFNFNIRIDSNFDRLMNFALISLNSAEELLQKTSKGDRR